MHVHVVPESAGALRLTGLPAVARYPDAEVSRDEKAITIRFGGLGDEQTMSVPLEYVGGDEEEVELMLLSRLREVGYRVRRG